MHDLQQRWADLWDRIRTDESFTIEQASAEMKRLEDEADRRAGNFTPLAKITETAKARLRAIQFRMGGRDA